MKLRTVLLAGVACTFAIGAEAARAQTTQNQGPPAGQDGAAPLSEVVVTATKRETKLEKTPIAITAFNQNSLNRQQTQDLTQLARFVPSLEFTEHGDQGSINLTMRGIGNDAAFTEVADPEVALYVDGIYSPRAQGASVLLYDMARVEVLRGPQGTLFGRNATVGAVNLITAQPTFGATDGYVEAVGGSYNRLGARGAINIPVTDTFALRFAFITDQHDGYVNFQQPPNVAGIDRSDFVTQGKKYYAQDQRSARISALWKPNDKFDWNINIEGYQDTGAPVIALMQNPRPGYSLWSALIDTAPQTDRYSYGVRSEMNYHINKDIQLTYIAGAGKVGGSADSDSDGGTLAPTSSTTPVYAFQEDHTVWSHFESYSHEIQLKSSGVQTVDWILGGYYSHEVNAIRFDIDQRNVYRAGTFGWAGSFIQRDREIESEAAFGQATWHINDRIRLTGGLRYTQDTKQDVGGRNITYSGCPTGDTVAQCNALTAAGEIGPGTPGIFGIDPGASAQQLLALLGPGYSISNNDVKGSWDKLTYLARIDADITSRILGYVSVSTGFKSGNIEDGGKLAGPETLTNYEAGGKIRMFDGRATLNLAVYYEDFVGYQVNQAVTLRDAQGNPISTSLVTQNAKGARAYGFEAEFNANLTREDHVQLAFSAQHTALEELMSIDSRLYSGNDLSHEVELKDHELPHAPRYSGTFMYEHSFNLGFGVLTPRITTHFEASSWLSYFEEGAPDRQQAYTRTDLLLHYEPAQGPWSVEAFVLNVENNNIKASAEVFGPTNNPPVWQSIYQPPITWGMRFRTRF